MLTVAIAMPAPATVVESADVRLLRGETKWFRSCASAGAELEEDGGLPNLQLVVVYSVTRAMHERIE